MRNVEVIVLPHYEALRTTYDLISANADGNMVIEPCVSEESLAYDGRPRVTVDSFGDFLELFNLYREMALNPRQTEEVYEIVVRKKGSR